MTSAAAGLVQSLVRLEQAKCAPGQAVSLLQTPASWVLLTPLWAYKIKKPIALPFLDFSTLALRHAACLEELRLNQRTAADLYVDVQAITGTPVLPQWGGEGPVIEYAVRMRRFDDGQRLDRCCRAGQLTEAHMLQLAQSIAQLQRDAARAPPDGTWGKSRSVTQPALDNLDIGERLLTDAPDAAALQRLRAWTLQQAQALAPLVEQRRQAGWVRECHGDLHLANMVLIQGQVRLFDALEFNPGLRWIDVASDLAFSYMDLLQNGQGGLANVLVNAVLAESGDYDCAPLLRFYAVYRAMVRAKVAALMWEQGQAPSDLALARDYLGLAERLAHPAPPRLVITHGVSGSGKTVASGAWLRADASGNFLRIRSDLERKRMFGLAPLQRSDAAQTAALYAGDAHQRTYAHLRALAAQALRAGWSVLVDAAFLRRAERDDFHRLADECGVAFEILAPQVDVEVLRERVRARAAAGTDASDAGPEVLERQLSWVEPLSADEAGRTPAPCPPG